MSLVGKRVLVIGGGSGIGYAVAEAALRDGAKVMVASTNAQRVGAAAAKLMADSAQLDVTDEAGVEAFFAGHGAFDHIAFTAGDWGGLRGVRLADLDLEQARNIFNVRFWGALTVAKHAAKVLPPGGSYTITDGTLAHLPQKGTVMSTAAAGAIEFLTRALAVELAPIRVNAVCPGMIRTEVWNAIPEERREASFTQMTKNQLIPRIGEVAEASEAYLYLMRGGYTTGQVLYVEGGSLLGR